MDKTKSLTVGQALSAHAVLKKLIELDFQHVFAFTGEIRIQFALTFRELRSVKEAFDDLNNGLITRLGVKVIDGNGQEVFKIEPNTPAMKEFITAQNELLSGDSKVILSTVTKAQLVGPKEATKAAQIPVDLVVLLIDVGLING